MAAPIVYRWDDGNAPVARGERRSLCDILYACLVTGYGTKPAAGWTREYVNATFDKAAFRNNPITGTGFYLQVDGLSPTLAYQPKVQGFEAMTSVDDGLFPFNAAVQLCNTSTTANTTARPWMIIADDRFCYFFCWYGITPPPLITSTTISHFIFGDILSRYTVDSFACLLVAATTGASALGVAHGPTVASGSIPSSAFAMPRNYAGVADPIAVMNVLGGGPGSGSASSLGSTGLAYTAGDQILVSRPHLTDGGVQTFRGWIPGLYYPCHPMAFGQLEPITVDGRNFISLRIGTANIFISLDDWRA